jgi:hypothetical protein
MAQNYEKSSLLEDPLPEAEFLYAVVGKTVNSNNIHTALVTQYLYKLPLVELSI